MLRKSTKRANDHNQSKANKRRRANEDMLNNTWVRHFVVNGQTTRKNENGTSVHTFILDDAKVTIDGVSISIHYFKQDRTFTNNTFFNSTPIDEELRLKLLRFVALKNSYDILIEKFGRKWVYHRIDGPQYHRN